MLPLAGTASPLAGTIPKGITGSLGAWPTTRLAAPWWEAVPVWMPFLGTEWDGQAF